MEIGLDNRKSILSHLFNYYDCQTVSPIGISKDS